MYVKPANSVKTTPTTIPKGEEREQRILDVVQSDVWGPAQMTTFSGCRYYVTFINNFSRHTSTFEGKDLNPGGPASFHEHRRISSTFYLVNPM